MNSLENLILQIKKANKDDALSKISKVNVVARLWMITKRPLNKNLNC